MKKFIHSSLCKLALLFLVFSLYSLHGQNKSAPTQTNLTSRSNKSKISDEILSKLLNDNRIIEGRNSTKRSSVQSIKQPEGKFKIRLLKDTTVLNTNSTTFNISSASNSIDGIKSIKTNNSANNRKQAKIDTNPASSELNSEMSSSSSPFEDMRGKPEAMEKRDAFSKHFKNADGSYTAVIGATPLHYKKDGKFLDINVNIVSNTSKDYPFANKTNLLESYFGATSNNGIKNATAEGETKEFLNTKMYWEVDGKEVGTLQSANAKININEDKAFYPNLYDKISAEFTIETGRRKLNYIIPDKASLGNIPTNADYLVFSEDILLPKGWTHKVTKGGILILDENKKEIYLYDNPSSSDALNKLS